MYEVNNIKHKLVKIESSKCKFLKFPFEDENVVSYYKEQRELIDHDNE